MEDLQIDAFSNGKSNTEAQIESAKLLLLKYGYKVIKTAEEVKELAIESGYKVSDPVVVDDKILTLKDLRNHFYKCLWSKYPNRQSHYLEGSWKSELRIFKLFVEARESSGLNRFNAIQECVRIINTIFEYSDQFNFKNPIDIRVLGQDKSGWITQKALFIINSQYAKSQEQETDELVNKIDEDYTNRIDLKSKASELDALLSKMEGNNG